MLRTPALGGRAATGLARSAAARVVLVAAVGLGALCAGPAAAGAHPLLVTAAPAPGSTVPGAPSRVTIALSEQSVARGSAVSVKAATGRRVAVGGLRATDGGRQLAVTLPKGLSPGVYRVHWVALGEDGHTVSGEFAFGIAEPNGSPPPGASGLGAAGGRGGNTAGEGVVSIAFRWLGILAASLLGGGALLLRALRRGRLPFRITLGVAVAAAVYGAFQQASAGAGGGLDLTLLSTGSGISALAGVVIAVLGGTAFLATRKSAVAGLTGFGLLAAYGLSGHVIAQGNTLAAAAMAVHVMAAGAWAGGLLGIALLSRSAQVQLAQAARAFAPIAVAGLGVAAATGAITAIREVSHWYFLWWSGYGRLVIIKVVLVAGATAAGAWTAWRARERTLRLEAGLMIAVIGAATILSGLAQGRGQPLPAQRGDLLPGPAFASAVLPSGPTPVTLAPARPGMNSVVVDPRGGARRVLLRMVCGCDPRPVIAELHRADGAFSAQIPVPTSGTWSAYVSVDGRAAAAPVPLDVGVSGAAGAPVRNVLAVADLSGPGAARCRSYLIGFELAIGRLNGSGGVDGGDKLALLARDDGGSAAQASAIAQSSLRGSPSPVAVVPCGAGAEPAVAVAARLGIPTIAGDPATSVVPGGRVFRVAGDPYADGVAIAEAIRREILPVSARTARAVEVVSVADAQGQRRLEGLRAALSAPPAIRMISVNESAITASSPAQLSLRLDRRRTVALVLDATDAQTPALAAAIRRLPGGVASAPVVASERVLSESFITASGDPGRVGMIQGTSTVAVDSRDGLILSQALPTLFPGERASLEGLRGYVAGLALVDGVANGTSAASIAARLTRPLPFTDAIPEPWRADAPDAGAQRLGVLEPTFLSSTLVPTSQGGEAYSGEYFSDGAWMRPTSALFGPSLRAPVVPVSGR